MNIINDVLVDKLFPDKPKRTKEIPLLEEKSVSGESIIIRDTYPDMPFKGLHVYGKSTQVTTTGAQLFDKTVCTSGNITDDGVIDRNGEVGEKDNIISGYIQCNEKENYTSSQNVYKWFFYNEEKRFIKSEMNKTKVTAPDMAKYLVLFYSIDTVNALKYLDNIMVNVGTSSLALEPYTGGKPSPSIEYPQEIVSVGDKGEIGVSVYGGNLIPETQIVDVGINKKEEPQILTLKTPNGLPGVPVDKNGNYIDTNGQLWAVDEKDLAREKYVQRIYITEINESMINSARLNWEKEDKISYKITTNLPAKQNQKCLSNRFVYGSYPYLVAISGKSIYFEFVDKKEMPTVEKFKQFLTDNKTTVAYILETPIEHDLTPEVIEQFKQLKTNYPTTVIMNDENAGMKVTYLTLSFIPTRESALRMWFKENPII